MHNKSHFTNLTRYLALSVISLALTLGCFVAPIHAARADLTFIAIGDTPYSSAENEQIQGSLTQAIQSAHLPFVVHYGDLKGGGESCSEALLRERQDDIYNLSASPVFYTPGDNEWTDCDRSYLESRASELEMLDLVRQLFFGEPMDLPESWAYTRQANFPENARWMYNDVLFTTIHLVSTNNGRQEILLDDIEAALALVDARDQADRVWLNEAFDTALDVGARAVVIITQADVTAPDAGGTCTPYNRMNCDAFDSFRQNLVLNASNFADRGQPRRPVLLIHGDTNPYCWDKTLGGELAPNLWRLNAWGDYQSPADATVITVQTDKANKPFKAETLLGGQEPAKSCI